MEFYIMVTMIVKVGQSKCGLASQQLCMHFQRSRLGINIYKSLKASTAQHAGLSGHFIVVKIETSLEKTE